jgi:tetratricopeptide (TPR) repeat protein
MRSQDLAAEYHNIGNGFFELKKYDKAIRYYEMALERNPDLAGARWNLALSYYRTGAFDAAERILDAWLARDPEAVEAREALALVYRGRGKRTEALDVLDHILSIAPEDTAALNNKAIILWELERKQEAIAAFQSYLQLEPYNPDVLYNVMLLYDEQGMSEKALEYAESFLSVAESADQKKTGDIVAASLVAARAYARAEVYYRALELYAHVTDLDAKQADAWFERSEILLTSVEDPSRGIEALTKALDAGFADRTRLALLLARDDLLDRERVRALLTDRSLAPAAADVESAKRSAASNRAAAVVEPQGPWADPGPAPDGPGPGPEEEGGISSGR